MGLTLRPFQQAAIDKFEKVTVSLIGDDMGLGKTIEGIMLDKRRRELFRVEFEEKAKGKALTLVVAPLSTLGGWANHFRKWNPELNVVMIDKKNRELFLHKIKKGKGDVFICHWEALRLIPELRKVYWFHVIADEVHRAKNRDAQQTQALKKLPTWFKTGLSGTPADNRPDDFWSILNWLLPKVFTSYWTFFNKHVIFKEEVNQKTGKKYRTILGCAEVDDLMQSIAPYYIRRLKEHVAKDLPDKYYTSVFVDLSSVQRRAYDGMRKRMLAWVGEHEAEPIAAPIVIAQLLRLQQFSGAFGEIIQITKRFRKDCPEGCPDGKCIGHLKDALKLTEPSTKLDAVMEIIADNPNEQMIIFSQSKQMINMLEARCKTKGVSVITLTGDTKGNREDLIEAFQAGKARIFAATIRAGGEGITLTAARTVIFLDRDWSPTKNRQAEDRAHRIGQKSAVQIIDIIARDTIDLGRIQKIEQKWGWIKEILGDKNPHQKELE